MLVRFGKRFEKTWKTTCQQTNIFRYSRHNFNLSRKHLRTIPNQVDNSSKAYDTIYNQQIAISLNSYKTNRPTSSRHTITLNVSAIKFWFNLRHQLVLVKDSRRQGRTRECWWSRGWPECYSEWSGPADVMWSHRTNMAAIVDRRQSTS